MFPSLNQSGLGETLLETQTSHKQQGSPGPAWELLGAPHLLKTHLTSLTLGLLCCSNTLPFSLLHPYVTHRYTYGASTTAAMNPSRSAARLPVPHTGASGHHQRLGAPASGKENKSGMSKHLGEYLRNIFHYSLCKLHLQLEHTRLFMRGICCWR